MNRDAHIQNRLQHIRALDTELVKYYEIEVFDAKPVGLKSYQLFTEGGETFFLKESNEAVLDKYQYLANQGANNVLYPIVNK
ncbi:MAG: hypothetical protein NC090_06895, partial [Anaeroplasma bactoclasticum]|nr:hypothetical protein [Anaeroplasma bactoclasticum]